MPDDTINVTIGFWSGLWFGIVIGLFVFGISWVGQAEWDAAIKTGRTICESEFAREDMYLKGEAP